MELKRKIADAFLILADISLLLLAILCIRYGILFRDNALFEALEKNMLIYYFGIGLSIFFLSLIFLSLPILTVKYRWMAGIYGGFVALTFILTVIIAIAFFEVRSAGPRYLNEQCTLSIVYSDLKKVDSIYSIANQDLCKTSCLCNANSSQWPTTYNASV
jgi:hypothetical protein